MRDETIILAERIKKNKGKVYWNVYEDVDHDWIVFSHEFGMHDYHADLNSKKLVQEMPQCCLVVFEI